MDTVREALASAKVALLHTKEAHRMDQQYASQRGKWSYTDQVIDQTVNAIDAALASQEAQSTGAPIHPQSLEGLVGESGGHYLTGGGAAFTSFALAKFVVLAVEHAAQPPHDMSREAAPLAALNSEPEPKGEWPDDYLPILTRKALYAAYAGKLSWCRHLEKELANCAVRIHAQREEIKRLAPPQPADKP